MTGLWVLGLLLGVDLMSHGIAWLTYAWQPAARDGQYVVTAFMRNASPAPNEHCYAQNNTKEYAR